MRRGEESNVAIGLLTRRQLVMIDDSLCSIEDRHHWPFIGAFRHDKRRYHEYNEDMDDTKNVTFQIQWR
jgi:hypothetical protein